ncbi:hypothetical protein L6R50_17805, partial [Myxococcota bacterium]|nr:hypothetical protein [Myxococcota bacterium]
MEWPRDLPLDPPRLVAGWPRGRVAAFRTPDGTDYVGLGEAARLDLGPGAGLGSLSSRLAALAERVEVPDSGPAPLLLGGFCFAPPAARGPWTGFPDGRFVLPRITVVRAKGQQPRAWWCGRPDGGA